MLNTEIEDIKKVIDRLLKSNSRINQSKENKYWYPLSLATYGLEEISECLESLCSFKTSMWEKTKYFKISFPNILVVVSH